MDKDFKIVWAVIILLLAGFILILLDTTSYYWYTPMEKEFFTQTEELTPTPTCEPYGISVSRSRPTDWVSPTPTPTLTPTPEPTPTETPTPTFTPTPAIVGTIKKAEVNGTHGWKPLAWYTAVNDRTMPQWRLQQIAKTDERGVRVVQDPNGEWRYCVALPVYWAGDSSDDIGRCVDIIMANGATLKCVLGDTKRIEKSVNGEGKYGIGHNEIIEVQCDLSKMNPIVPQMGDASYIGPEWVGDVAEVIALDMFIDGFGN